MKELNLFEIQIKQEIEELVKEINKHDLLYAEGRPEISDPEYDKLYAKLVKLEDEYPHFVLENSPTNKIVELKVEGFEEITHKYPILSQDKAYTDEDITDFVDRVSIQNVENILVQHKLDGLTIVLEYEEGVLVRASSRGDGRVGSVITHLAKNISNIPLKLNSNINAIIRGEGLIYKKDFKVINEELKSQGLEPYKSARNLASGTMRSLEGRVAKDRKVQFIAFDVLESDKNFSNDLDALKFLYSEGFDVADTKVFKISDINNLLYYLKTFNDIFRPSLKYTIDGLVLKIDDFNARTILGETIKYPKWSCAFKFEAEEVETTLLDVKWQVGRTGKLTPVGIVDAVEIDGVTVTKASLANWDNIQSRNLKIGDTIKIRRAGEVIPQITGVVEDKRNGNETEIVMPSVCPICDKEVLISVEGKDNTTKITCENKQCLARTETRLIHFASKNNMDIEKFGDKLIIRLIDLGLLESIEDIYNLHKHKEQLVSLDGLGEKSISTVLENIEKSKNAPLDRVISALGIHTVGPKKAKVIANHFESMDNIFEFLKQSDRKETLLQLEDFGDIVSTNFLEFFDDEDNLNLVKKLKDVYGFTMKKEEIVISEDLKNANTDNIKDKIFVITGSMSMPRHEMKAKIEALGGKVTGSVSSKTNFLLLGEDKKNSSKHKTAISLNIPILSEEDFNNML